MMTKLIQFKIVFFVSFLMGCMPQDIVPEQMNHGKIKGTDPVLVWNSSAEAWMSPDDFWVFEAESRGGLTWQKNTVYPDYDLVKEFDTFLVEVPSGTCLMAFYHARWRRANDVWRWDAAFNDYSGCPAVFD